MTRKVIAEKPTAEHRRQSNGIVETRAYAEDRCLHLYRTEHVADPAYRMLIPVCQEDRLYPARHERELISASEVTARSHCDNCALCSVWARREWRGAPAMTDDDQGDTGEHNEDCS
jgi:hypothetical protein